MFLDMLSIETQLCCQVLSLSEFSKYRIAINGVAGTGTYLNKTTKPTDKMILQSNSLPKKITSWNLEQLETFNSSYLAGFITEKYTLSLEDGHLKSNQKAREIAISWAKQDIGGDTQRVSSLDMNLAQETFKHILLPVYISSYVFNNKKYHFYVNGQSGVIEGDRPYSFWKIFFLVLAVLTTITCLVTFIVQNQ